MTYNNAIPNPNDIVLQSQVELLDNFQEIFKAFNVNHIPMNQENEGKHSLITLERQGGAPATAADECALYTLLGTDSQSQLFYRPDSNGVQIQMSYQDVVTTGLKQRSFMAGPFIFFLGRVDNLNVGSNLISLSPSVTTLLSVQAVCTAKDYAPSKFPNQSFSVSPTLFTVNSFTVVFSPTNPPPKFNIYYIAIGLV